MGKSMCVAIRWASRERTMELTGIPENLLLQLVSEGKVGCRKSNASSQSRTVFCVPDVEDWWDNEAVKVTQLGERR